MALLAQGGVHSRAVSDVVLAHLARCQDSTMLPRYLEVNPFADALRADAPPFVVRHKTGGVTGVRNDAGLITRGEQTLAVAVYSMGCPDTRWTAANAGVETVARVGRLLCDHFFR